MNITVEVSVNNLISNASPHIHTFPQFFDFSLQQLQISNHLHGNSVNLWFCVFVLSVLDFVVFNTTLHMDYDVIKKATNNFDEKNKLGEGSFGKVYLADINQTKYAVKVLLQVLKLIHFIRDKT